MRIGLRLCRPTQSLRALHQPLRRGIFGFFESKETVVERKDEGSSALAPQGQTFNQNKPRALSKKEAYFEELRLQREKEDAETLRKKAESDFLEGSARKETDVTLRTLDYRTIILVNRQLLPSGSFKSLDDFKTFMVQAERQGADLSEELTEKILSGLLDYADQAGSELANAGFFPYFLYTLQTSVSYLTQPRLLTLVAAFMDVYCINDPPSWHALETQIVAKKDKFSLDEVVAILTHFANQGEGTDALYDHIETRLSREFTTLSTQKLVDVITSFFNRRVGRKEFVFDLLTEITARVSSDLSLVDMGVIRRLALCIRELGEQFQELQSQLFREIEEKVLEKKMDLTFKDCCLLAKAFGFDYGSARLFIALDAITLEELPEADLERVKLYVDGFLLSYKVTKEAFEVLDSKLSGFLPAISIFDSVHIAKAYYMLGHDQRPLVKQIEQKVLVALYNDWESMDQQTLYETVYSYTLTRMGSRELYRVLELVLGRRLLEIAKDRDMLKRLIRIYQESGMCSHQFLNRMKQLE